MRPKRLNSSQTTVQVKRELFSERNFVVSKVGVGVSVGVGVDVGVGVSVAVGV